jgi:hypothetical protein
LQQKAKITLLFCGAMGSAQKLEEKSEENRGAYL